MHAAAKLVAGPIVTSIVRFAAASCTRLPHSESLALCVLKLWRQSAESYHPTKKSSSPVRGIRAGGVAISNRVYLAFCVDSPPPGFLASVVTDGHIIEGRRGLVLAFFGDILAFFGNIWAILVLFTGVTDGHSGHRWSQMVTVGHRIGEGWVRPLIQPQEGGRVARPRGARDR